MLDGPKMLGKKNDWTVDSSRWRSGMGTWRSWYCFSNLIRLGFGWRRRRCASGNKGIVFFWLTFCQAKHLIFFKVQHIRDLEFYFHSKVTCGRHSAKSTGTYVDRESSLYNFDFSISILYHSNLCSRLYGVNELKARFLRDVKTKIRIFVWFLQPSLNKTIAYGLITGRSSLQLSFGKEVWYCQPYSNFSLVIVPSSSYVIKLKSLEGKHTNSYRMNFELLRPSFP